MCFFLAIKRMAGLPSFHEGGAAWFLDLAAADPTYVMPLLSSATFLATVEVRRRVLTWRCARAVLTPQRRLPQLGAADGMQGNPAANNIKWGLRALSVALVPMTASFPQARKSAGGAALRHGQPRR